MNLTHLDQNPIASTLKIEETHGALNWAKNTSELKLTFCTEQCRATYSAVCRRFYEIISSKLQQLATEIYNAWQPNPMAARPARVGWIETLVLISSFVEKLLGENHSICSTH